MRYRENGDHLEPAVNLTDTEQDNLPLGRYGQTVLQYMKEHHEARVWELTMNGRLMPLLHQREEELQEQKLKLLEELERQNPRPRTESLRETAAHLNSLEMQAEELLREELYQPV